MEIEELRIELLLICRKGKFSIENINKKIVEYYHEFYDDRFIQLAKGAAKCCGVDLAEVISSGRKSDVVLARRLVYSFYRTIGYSLEDCGQFFGQDHSTVIHAVNTLIVHYETSDSVTVEAFDLFQEKLKEFKLKQIDFKIIEKRNRK